MKKLLAILFILPLTFGSCEKEDDSPDGNNSGNNNNPIVNTTTGYFCDNYGRIYKTTDSGINWTQQTDFTTTGTGISFP